MLQGKYIIVTSQSSVQPPDQTGPYEIKQPSPQQCSVMSTVCLWPSGETFLAEVPCLCMGGGVYIPKNTTLKNIQNFIDA